MRSLLALVALLLAGVAFAALPEVDKPAPDFNVPAVNVTKALPDAKDKNKLSLSSLKGKNVVLFLTRLIEV